MDSQPPTQPATYHIDDDSFSESENEDAPPKAWGRLFSESTDLPSIELTTDSYSFGRHNSCDTIFQDPIISNKHCRIYRQIVDNADGHTVFIEDTSSNGTFINGTRLGKSNKVVLKHNDKIMLTQKKRPGGHSAPTYVFYDCSKASEDNQDTSPIKKKYHLLKNLGNGACGEVWLAVDKSTGQQSAVKIISKKRFSSIGQSSAPSNAALMQEVEILRELDHPCIIKVQEAYDTPEKLYIVLELAKGGEFFDRIVQKSKFTEKETIFFFYQLFNALSYLHNRGIAHRDLKPENLLLDSDSMDTIIKVTDFGLAKLVGPQGFMKTMCGTPSYQAPEVLLTNGQKNSGEGYGTAVDIWSLGVILYICLCGFSPFGEELEWQGEKSLHDQVVSGSFYFVSPFWDEISDNAKDLISKMLTVDAEKRITIAEALEHPFMQDKDVLEKAQALIETTRLKRQALSNGSDASAIKRGNDEYGEGDSKRPR